LGGVSAVIWAQDPTDQKASTGGDWSWSTVRDHYYNYLTATTQAGEDDSLSKMLVGLGYQMHLLQDMSQPDHVRNNTHMADGSGYLWGLETWAKDHRDIVKGFAQGTIPEVTVDITKPFTGTTSKQLNIGPVANLFDTRTYYSDRYGFKPSVQTSQGLSEYTNSNFFSHSTIFAADRFSTSDDYYFPNPTKASTDLQSYINKTKVSAPDTVDGEVVDKSNYVAKNSGGETLTYLARQGVLTRFVQSVVGEGKYFYSTFKLDDACYYDYSKKLIPMAVGYSAALLDYFFRGDLAVTIPPNTPPTNNRIRLSVHNSTLSGETLDGGSIDLMVIFRPYSTNGTPSGILTPAKDMQYRRYSYGTCTRDNPVCKIGAVDSTLDFDLSSNPLPPLARDISLVLVYRGKLGNELDSVAFSEVNLDGIEGDMALSLPATGAYASTDGDNLSSTFTDLAIAGQNTSDAEIGPGTTQLLAIYRQAKSDPFQSKQVETSSDIYYTSATIPDDQGITRTAKDQLFSLATGIPVTATDLYVYLIHTDKNGKITYGYRDISEPTPVDVFNNADQICINNQWYAAGSSEAVALAGKDAEGDPAMYDPYPHNIDKIFARAMSAGSGDMASVTDYTFASSDPISGGGFRRLGFILTDYNFSYSFLDRWLDADARDPFVTVEPAARFSGTAVKNQTDADGNTTFSSMYMMRGIPMWWGAGVVWDNASYPSTSSCDWSALHGNP
jgi:hypothetical protein